MTLLFYKESTIVNARDIKESFNTRITGCLSYHGGRYPSVVSVGRESTNRVAQVAVSQGVVGTVTETARVDVWGVGRVSRISQRATGDGSELRCWGRSCLDGAQDYSKDGQENSLSHKKNKD